MPAPPSSEGPARSSSPRWLWLSLGAVFLLGLGVALSAWPYQVDDAFITYRFARNLSAGWGLRFDALGPRVEGFSSPLWLLLCGLASALSLPVPATSAVFGILSHAATVWLLARRCGALSAMLWCAAPTALFYASTGLEEPLFVLCVVAASTGGRASSWGAVLGPWVRPEGPLLAPLGALLRASRGAPLAGCLRALLLPGFSFSALLLARRAYFGEWLPNTAYAKAPSLAAGARYLLASLAQPRALALLLAAALVARTSSRARAFLGAAAVWALACVAEGGDWMPQSRLLAPALVLLAMSAGEAPSVAEGSWARALRVAALATAVLAGFSAAGLQSLRSRNTQRTLVQENLALARSLERRGVRSAALVDVGAVGYALPGLSIVDLGGLTDARIARSPGGLLQKRFDLAYLFEERRPAAVVLRLSRVSEGAPRPEDALSEVEARVLADPRFDALYLRAELFAPAMRRENTYARALYLRRVASP